MPRDLKASSLNKLVIQDAISGSAVELHYRMPTTSEMISYQARAIKREGNKLKNRLVETRLEFGARILTGFRAGDFTFDGEPLASGADEKGYRDNWRELVEEAAPDLIAALAYTVFEGARAIGTEEIDFAPDEAPDAPRPFP